MPNHYDIDILCEKCGNYIKTFYEDEDIKPSDRVCDSCKTEDLAKAIVDFIVEQKDV